MVVSIFHRNCLSRCLYLPDLYASLGLRFYSGRTNDVDRSETLKHPKKDISVQLVCIVLLISVIGFLFHRFNPNMALNAPVAGRPTCAVCHSDKSVVPIYQVNDGGCGLLMEPDLSCSPEATEVIRHVHLGPGTNKKIQAGWFCKSCRRILSIRTFSPFLY